MSGVVYTDGKRVDKAGALFPTDTEWEVRISEAPFVSRGGEKLAGALESFGVRVAGLVALDVGASTGGFTDCLLQNGAAKVFAVDVGYGQLDWKLRNDSRVIPLEKVNARSISPETLGSRVEIAVIDVSFISLTKIVPAVLTTLEQDGQVIALIKPQFEVGRGEVGKGGVVRDAAKHTKVIETITGFIEELGCEVKGVAQSVLLGPKGNKEFFIYFIKKGVRENASGG